jgi:hypothetical protein
MFTSKVIILSCGFRENKNIDNSRLRGAKVESAYAGQNDRLMPD